MEKRIRKILIFLHALVVVYKALPFEEKSPVSQQWTLQDDYAHAVKFYLKSFLCYSILPKTSISLQIDLFTRNIGAVVIRTCYQTFIKYLRKWVNLVAHLLLAFNAVRRGIKLKLIKWAISC